MTVCTHLHVSVERLDPIRLLCRIIRELLPTFHVFLNQINRVVAYIFRKLFVLFFREWFYRIDRTGHVFFKKKFRPPFAPLTVGLQ